VTDAKRYRLSFSKRTAYGAAFAVVATRIVVARQTARLWHDGEALLARLWRNVRPALRRLCSRAAVTRITVDRSFHCQAEPIMEPPSLVVAISKLAAAGQQAGFTLEEMIELLDGGLGVETRLVLIAWRLEGRDPPAPPTSYSSWVV
jgi:hypothetical protein